MGLSMRISHRLETRQSLSLTLEQRLSIRNYLFEMQMALVGALHGERYETNGTCPKCRRQLTTGEILRGFNRDPNDFTTRCTKCGDRFEPQLIAFTNGARIELPFYCDNQVLAQLGKHKNLSPEILAQKHPAIYRSAIVHHGSISAAFQKAGIKYNFDETLDWKNKIAGFLGKLPDTVIAKCARVAVYKIRAMRRQMRIPRFTTKVAMAEME